MTKILVSIDRVSELKKKILILILTAARALGFFRLSAWLTRRQLRILAYHGAAIKDENRFRPGLFISRDVFVRRLDYLDNRAYTVIPLQEALQKLDTNTLPDYATVITIDDGWHGTYSILAPELQKRGFKSTLYASSYYMLKQTQVFNVALDYLFWLTNSSTIELSNIDARLNGSISLNDPLDRSLAVKEILKLATSIETAEQRQLLLRSVSTEVQVDLNEIEQEKILALMSMAEAADLEQYGMDIQLHTHRHRFLDCNEECMVKEIADNRHCLESVATQDLNHFCYPSGFYEEHQIPWLKKLGIESATTTRPGFVTSKSDKHKLSRFLDDDSITDIEFDAEMTGFFELVRKCGYRI